MGAWRPLIVIAFHCCAVIEDNLYDTSPCFRPVRFPKLQIFVEMFRRNLQSPGTTMWRPDKKI